MTEPYSAWDEKFDSLESPELPDSVLGIEDEELFSEDTLSLLNVGRLTHEITVRGHVIRLRTLKIGEELQIGLLIKKYTGSPEEGRAYTCAVVAASIDSIDGHPLVGSFSSDEDYLTRKFDYVRSKLYWPVIKEIYDGYIDLLGRQADSLEELDGKSPASLD